MDAQHDQCSVHLEVLKVDTGAQMQLLVHFVSPLDSLLPPDPLDCRQASNTSYQIDTLIRRHWSSKSNHDQLLHATRNSLALPAPELLLPCPLRQPGLRLAEPTGAN